MWTMKFTEARFFAISEAIRCDSPHRCRLDKAEGVRGPPSTNELYESGVGACIRREVPRDYWSTSFSPRLSTLVGIAVLRWKYVNVFDQSEVREAEPGVVGVSLTVGSSRRDGPRPEVLSHMCPSPGVWGGIRSLLMDNTDVVQKRTKVTSLHIDPIGTIV